MLLLMPLSAQGANGVHTWAEHSALSEGSWVKVALNNTTDGIYAISYSQLRSWGFSNPEQVGVYGFGGHALSESFSQPHIDDLPEVNTLHDSANQRILFYGRGLITWSFNKTSGIFEHQQHPYATQAYYFLHQKSTEAPAAIDTLAATATTPSYFVNEFDEYWLYEQERVNLGQSGRELYGESFTSTQYQKFTLPGEGTAEEGHTIKQGTAHITAAFATNSSSSSKFTLSWNKAGASGSYKEIGQQEISATTGRYAFGTAGTFDQDFQADDLTGISVAIKFTQGTATASIARLNYIRVQGKMALEASSNEAYLLFRNKQANTAAIGYRITGVTGKMQIWDVTNPTQIKLQGTSLKADTTSFVSSEKGIREYAIVNTESKQFPGVSRIGNVVNQDLHNAPEADFIIVSASAYLDHAKQLASFRETNNGLRTLVVTPEQIYNEYSSGTPDATAIRLFAKQFYDRYGTLKYLLLWGDGHYNNRQATKSNLLLPTYESEASMVETSSFVCDDYFGFLDDSEGGQTNSDGVLTINSDRLDIGVGRLPVSSTSESEILLNKILDYSRNTHYGVWKNRLVFLSDDDKMESSGTDAPNTHMRHNDKLINSLEAAGHKEYIFQKIYLPAYQQSTTASGTDYPDARREFNNALQQGSLIVNFAGHGSSGSITHEQIMNTARAKELRMKNLPLWILASCDVMRFDADEPSMAEALLLNANGGASAIIGSSRVVYSDRNLILNQAIVDHLFDRNADGTRYRLGDILKAAKIALGSDYNKLNYGLLGDPSMELSYPDHKIVVDDVSYDEMVSVSGHLEALGTQATDTTFNGLIYSTIFGANDTISANKGLWQEPLYTFQTRTKKVFSGRDRINNGQFSFSFFMPQDLSASANDGLINLYACSDNDIEANGYYDSFKLTHNGNSKADTVPPVLYNLFLDSPDFKSGDKVGTTPFFYAEVADESGFNTTGNRIGHDLTLSIRSLSNPLFEARQYNLNSYFTTFTGMTTRGNVKYSISALEEGTYEGTFRIWDAFNNPLTATFQFTVSTEQAPEVTLLQAYPSPVHQGQSVTFRAFHNRPESADELHIQVYTQTGVKVLDKTVSSSSAEVVYLQPGATSATQVSSEMNADETSQLQGCSTMQWTVNVAPGVYMYRAFFSSGGTETSTKSKILIVL